MLHPLVGSLRLLPLLVIPVAFAGPTVEERLQELESRVTALSSENTALRQQLGVCPGKSPVFITTTGKEKSLTLGGYAQIQAEMGDAPDSRFPATDRFLIRRARLGVKASFAEHIDFVLMTDFGGGLGTTASYRAQLTDLYAVWNQYSFANITVGQFKTPFGYEQLSSDTKLPLIERSLPNDRLTLSRQTGAMVSGDIIEKRLDYAAGLFNGNGVTNNANDNDNFTYVGRVSGVVVEHARLKLSAGTNAFQTHDTAAAFTGDRTGYGFDLQAQSGRFEAGAEWLQTKSSPTVGADTTAQGWSAFGSYFIVPKQFQAVVRYETYDPSTNVSDDDSDIWTVGLNYLLKGNDLKLSLNYLLGDPAGPLNDQGRLIGRVQVVF
jgi:phosphate-selective porin OprO and OprP